MKTESKILIAVLSLVLFMTVLPWASTVLGDGFATTGLWFFAFFTVYPLLAVVLGAMAGTDLPRLWWIPLAMAALFPLLFGIAIRDLVWDLYIYSAIYLPLGGVSMLLMHFVKKNSTKNKQM